jgi:6-phosphogluconate dehydrogenase
MIHNGIEHGMMSAIAEAFNIMRDGLGMELDEMADVFEKWNKEGELVSVHDLFSTSYHSGVLTSSHSKEHS